MSLDAASLLAPDPPSIGDTLEVTIFPPRLAALPTMKAQVIRVVRDVAQVERNRFDVSFLELDDGLLDRLTSALVALDARSVPIFIEHRAAIRVDCALDAQVETSAGSCPGIITSLSFAGAMLCVASDAFAVAPARGAQLRLRMTLPEASERLSVGAKVVWTAVAPRQRLIGIELERGDQQALIRIRDLILDTLTL